jgi:hypothetical protein
MNTQRARERAGGAWSARSDGWWLTTGRNAIRNLARALKLEGVRFAALTLRPEGERLRLSWHWDAGGVLLSVETLLEPDTAVPSIVDHWPGADWAEREIRYYYAVTFEGRDSTPTLMLREGDEPGVLLHPKGGERA